MNVEAGQPIRLHAVIQARQDLVNPRFPLHFNNAEGVQVFELDSDAGKAGTGGCVLEGGSARAHHAPRSRTP